MEAQPRCSHKYLVLQVWCGLLTVAMVVMAALLASIRSKSTEDVSRPDGPTAHPSVIPPATQMKSVGSSLAYIQLMKSQTSDRWEETPKHQPSSLVLSNNSILCGEESLYFIYAQVTFSKLPTKNLSKYVRLRKNPRRGISTRILVEGSFLNTVVGSVWVAKIVKLQKNDSVSLEITGDTDSWLSDNTFWGAYQLQ